MSAQQRLRVSRPGRPALDLSRDVHALFGLVFDATTLDGACEHLLGAMREQRPCFLSTPNVNFAMTGLSDPAFRGSVRRSDFSVGDGKPLVILGRWMGLPLAERVAGADLFARLRHRRLSPGEAPIRVFFFGGPPGVSAAACTVLNAEHAGMQGVGSDEAGFGDVVSMSAPPVLDRIAQSNPQLISVALGAHKGQAWIEHNRASFPPAVVSHLGAVVNFVAGRVERAPDWVQRIGMEWVWRIRQEPALWRRYFNDGVALIGFMSRQLLPWWWQRRRMSAQALNAPSTLRASQRGDETLIDLTGAWTATSLAPLRAELAEHLAAGRHVGLNLAEVTHVDSAFLGLAAIVQAWQGDAVIVNTSACSPWVRRSFAAHGMDDLLAHT
jgi:N-acetylglucosaminyldiphosphoundecaprenol N-acetyl-beta-D-mannosaminyltransferase